MRPGAVKQIKGYALIGIMEYWKDGFKGKRTIKIFFSDLVTHYSNTPIL